MSEVGSGGLFEGLPDLAWIVRPGDNEELRYSLRSVAQNAAGLYRRIWIVGSCPEWVTGVEKLPLEPLPEKFTNIRQSVTAIANNEDVADRLVIFNDDHFLMDPITTWDAWHLGRTSAYVEARARGGCTPRTNTWIRAVVQCAEWMRERGYGDILCYESHTPIPFHREALARILDAYTADLGIAYPAFYPEAGWGDEGIQAGNSKVRGTDWTELNQKLANPMPWLSSNDASFAEGMIGAFVRGAFRQPCQYERPGPCPS